MSLLQVQGLRKSFGGVQAVQGVSFALQAGELLALIGPNGAGKSTTFNLVGGQLPPDAGRVLLQGQDITGLAPRAVWRRGVGRTFQIAQTFASFTVLQNVQMALLSHDRQAWRWWRRADAHRPQDALALLEQLGEPLMSVSLIMPGDELPMSDPYEMRQILEHHVDLIIDGGFGGLEASTVVSLADDSPQVLRVGCGDPTPFSDL